jgi:hypothetical protein
MEAEEDEPDACLQSQLLAVKHCLEAAKGKEHQPEASELDSPCPRKKRICKKYFSEAPHEGIIFLKVSCMCRDVRTDLAILLTASESPKI